jgi:hypothetical protein
VDGRIDISVGDGEDGFEVVDVLASDQVLIACHVSFSP